MHLQTILQSRVWSLRIKKKLCVKISHVCVTFFFGINQGFIKLIKSDKKVYNVHNISISNKCCSFEHFLLLKNPEK